MTPLTHSQKFPLHKYVFDRKANKHTQTNLINSATNNTNPRGNFGDSYYQGPRTRACMDHATNITTMKYYSGHIFRHTSNNFISADMISIRTESGLKLVNDPHRRLITKHTSQNPAWNFKKGLLPSSSWEYLTSPHTLRFTDAHCIYQRDTLWPLPPLMCERCGFSV